METFFENMTFIGIGGCGSNTVFKCMKNNADIKAFIVDRKMGAETKRGLEKLGINDPDHSSVFFPCNSLNFIKISEWLEDNVTTEKVAIVCGLGGSYASAMVTVIAEEAKNLSKEVFVLCFTPFRFEAKIRHSTAKETLVKLLSNKSVDYFAYMPNDELLACMSRTISFPDAQKCADSIILYVLGEMLKKNCPERSKIGITGHVDGDLPESRSDCVNDGMGGYFKISILRAV